MEREVVQGLDFDPSPKGVRYENDQDRFLVTIWTEGETFSEERLEAIQTRAEELADELAAGTPVVVETTDDDPPRQGAVDD